MGRLVTIVTVALAAVAGGCSSGPSNVCCLDYNGAVSNWQCPNAAAETACCGTVFGDGVPGCLAMDPAASTCTDNASASDCP
jgi:hypothetical protein